MHAGEHGLRIVQILEAQVLWECLAIDFGRELRVCVKRFDFGTIDEPIAVLRVVERLDTEDIACAYELTSHIIPDCNGEHAAQALEHAHSPFFVAVHDGLGIAFGGEFIARLAQLFAQFLEVIDFPVEGDNYVALSVFHRLRAAFEVDDGQPTEAHRNPLVDVIAIIVWAAMSDAVSHIVHDGVVGFLVVVDCRKPHESAHVRASSFLQMSSIAVVRLILVFAKRIATLQRNSSSAYRQSNPKYAG